MKIIAFGDVHMATSKLNEIAGLREADLVLVTGDITNFGYLDDIRKSLDDILTYNPNLLCLAGNLDNVKINDYLEELGINLHGQAHMVKRKVCLHGVGGSNPTPFSTPWELSEDQLAKAAEEGYLQAKELIDLAAPLVGYRVPVIFVSHAPPRDSRLDTIKNGKHVGSQAIRNLIERTEPDLCLCGHIHESKGIDTIGTTPTINTGALLQGGWATIEINKTRIDFQLS